MSRHTRPADRVQENRVQRDVSAAFPDDEHMGRSNADVETKPTEITTVKRDCAVVRDEQSDTDTTVDRGGTDPFNFSGNVK